MTALATRTYLERLSARSSEVGSVLCLGIDPDIGSLPIGFARNLAGLESFARLLVEVASPYAAAVKPNLAFFEAHGSAGMAALERIRATIPPGIPVIADAKRGDIGTTAARQAVALFDALGADAVTVNPYLGSEAVAPLLERLDRFAYILCRTSNAGAGELQDLVLTNDGPAPSEPLYARVARRAGSWGPGGTVGLVVGATAPDELERIRDVAPGLAFLVPGVGAQGGDIGAVLRSGPASASARGRLPGGGLLVNVSRGISGAANAGVSGAANANDSTRELDPAEQIRAAAANWAGRLPVLT